MNFKRLMGLLLAMVGGAQLACAHPLPARNATLRLIDRNVYLEVSVPVSALQGVDDDHDGQLSGEELARHNAAIVRQFTSRFQLESGNAAAIPDFVWVVIPQMTKGVAPPTANVLVLAGEHFAARPTALSVRTSLFGRAAGECTMTVRAQNGRDIELGVLNATSPQHRFFEGLLESFEGFVRVGVEHILLGYDHLLFLLTVVIAGANLRYWASVITSFTIAHSITLSLAVLGMIHVSPDLVEPAIAASIVLMAVDNLVRKARVGRERIVLVLACGLLHGLGFASALGEVGLDSGHRIASLAGFNLGVELGQATFVAGVLALGACFQALSGRPASQRWPMMVSAIAAIAGCVMVIDRVASVLGFAT